MRTFALLQTRAEGAAFAERWITQALVDNEDRAYALLGIAQALFEDG